MTDRQPDVPFLLPLRVHQARNAVALATIADISAFIDALPTAAPSPANGDGELTKAWALSVIRALPTLKGPDDGNC